MRSSQPFLAGRPLRMLTIAFFAFSAVFGPGSIAGTAAAQDPIFEDVPIDHWAKEYIEILYLEGYTKGCSEAPLLFCPDQPLSRAESAVFIERGVHGADIEPLPPSEEIFIDVPLSEWFAKWTTALWNDRYTAGCQTDPLAFCPLQYNTIAEGTVFYLRMLKGPDYQTSSAQGIFEDVPDNAWFAPWIEEAYLAGILLPCQTTPTLKACPNDQLTRAMAAYMMVQALGLNIQEPIGGPSIWISLEEIMKLPTSGPYWDEVRSAANRIPGEVAQGGHGSIHDVDTLAAALVAVRLQDEQRKHVVADEIQEAILNHVELDGNSLSLTRTLPGYILAADIIDLPHLDPRIDNEFRSWLEYVVYELKLDGKTQVEKHLKANNHGTQAAIVRFAADLYLGKIDDFRLAAEMLKAWLGDTSTFQGEFDWGNLCWQADPIHPVGINRPGSTLLVDGQLRNVDGVQPDEQRRSGCPGDQWPPPEDVHVWGGLQGIVGQLHILARQGYDSWSWGGDAALRAVSWQFDPTRGNAPASGDDLFILPMIDCVYGTDFWAGQPAGFGKQLGWTAWTSATMFGKSCST